jgi:Ala-tRNA(Pro) deacylase
MSSRFASSYSRQIPGRLIKCLNENAVRYEILHEPQDPSDSRWQILSNPGFIETTVLRTKKQHLLAVIPAGNRIDLKKFAQLIGQPIRVETEDEFKWLFPDCALGTIPPFGNLYGLATWLDTRLARAEHIVFFAGTPIDSIKLACSAYVNVVRPNIGAFSGQRPL